MSGFMEWGGDAPETSQPHLGGGNTERFKGKKGETYRLSFAWWPMGDDNRLNLSAKKPRFIGGKRVYIPTVGYVLYKGPEFNGFGDSDPKIAIGTIVVIWPTDKAGNVDQNRLAAGDYKVASWVFSESRYKVLDNQWREWPAGEHDITALCEDEQYQKMTFAPCKNNLLKAILTSSSDKHKILADDILSKVRALEAKIGNEVARDLTIDEVKLKLGKSTPPPVSPAGGGMSTQVDSMLDNILDD